MKRVIILCRTSNKDEFNDFKKTGWFKGSDSDTLTWQSALKTPDHQIIICDRNVSDEISQAQKVLIEKEKSSNDIFLVHNHQPNHEFAEKFSCCKIPYSTDDRSDFEINVTSDINEDNQEVFYITVLNRNDQTQLIISLENDLDKLFDFLLPACSQFDKLETALETLHSLLNGYPEDAVVEKLKSKLDVAGFDETESVLGELSEVNANDESAYIKALGSLKAHLMGQLT